MVYLKLQSVKEKYTLIFTDSKKREKKWKNFKITLIHIDDIKRKIKIKIENNSL